MTGTIENGKFNPTAEELQKIYDGAVDSAAYIKAGKPIGMDNEDWERGVKRNKIHLSTILGQYNLEGFDTNILKTALEV